MIFFNEEWKLKVKQLGLKYNTDFKQMSLTSQDYNDPINSIALQILPNIDPRFKFNTFLVVMYTKPTSDKIWEEHEFTIRL